jgi:Holliday junction resolvase
VRKQLNKRYIAGKKFEYEVKEHYEKEGYYVARAAGSKGIADLVAIPNRENYFLPELALLIQCKKTSYKKLSKREIREFLETASKYKAIPILATKEGKRTVFFEGEDALRNFLLGDKRK